MESAMQKCVLIAPITSLASGLNNTIYAGSGNELITFTHSGRTRFHVFDHHNVHGINACVDNQGYVVVHGDKSVDTCYTKEGITSAVDSKRNLDDLVLATCIVNNKLFIGYAHNFVDVYSFNFTSGNSIFLHRTQASDNCCLFCMTIVPDTKGGIVIVAGTAMGRIDVWLATGDATNIPVDAKYAIDRHEGVIFRTLWNTDKTLLVSVSDDRSVRLWDMKEDTDTYTNDSDRQLFVGWGHVSRVWDVCFLHEKDSLGYLTLATCSEDATIKIWKARVSNSVDVDLSTHKDGGFCVHTLRGHQSDVWRVLPVLGSDQTQLLLSCGNDSAIKVWDVSSWADSEYHKCLRRRAAIPSWPVDKDIDTEKDISINSAKKQSKARERGVAGVSCSPCAAYLVVALIEGGLWMVKNILGEAEGEEWIWSSVWSSNVKISHMSTNFVSCATDTNNIHPSCIQTQKQVLIALAHPRGLASCVLLSLDTCKVEYERQWAAHDLNTVSVWLLNFANTMTNVNFDLRLITTSVKGKCKMWRVYENDNHNHSSNVSMDMIFDGVTGGRMHEVVTSVAVLRDNTNDGTSKEILVAGDIRGSVSIWSLGLDVISPESGQQQEPSQFLHRVHDGVVVGSIIALSGGITFATTGHDGNIALYERDAEKLLFKVINIFSTLPIRAPLSLQIASDGKHPGGLYISGYYGETFIVYDMKNSNQLMNVDGGSWKRKSTCTIYGERSTGTVLPGIIFMCAVPTTSAHGKGTELEWYHNKPLNWDLGNIVKVKSTSQQGQVCYAGAYIGSHLATGGEAGRLHLLGPIFNDDRPLLQEASLPHFLSIKTLSSIVIPGAGSRGFLVGGGSRLSYSVWYWRDSGIPLVLAASGSVWVNAPQDHRILCSAVEILDDKYCIALCDSRGKAALALHPCLKAEDSDGVLVDSDSAGSNECPIPHIKTIPSLEFIELEVCKGFPVLTCKLLNTCNGMLGVFGSTSGEVSIWKLGPTFGGTDEQSYRLASINAHGMGANALDAYLTSSGHLIVCSGGDDESLTLTCGVLNSDCTTWLSPLYVRRCYRAASTSLQGVSLIVSNGLYELITLSADQRVHRWYVKMYGDEDESSWPEFDCQPGDIVDSVCECAYEDDCEDGFGLKWIEGICSNIGDPQAMATGTGQSKGRMAVIGQGTQELNYN
jgi:WD40 repeat protein